jgi:hypothetical protein
LKSIFVKDPKKRITIEAIRNHPWVLAGSSGPPPQVPPILSGPPETNFGSLIQSMYASNGNEENLLVYTLRPVVPVNERKRSSSDNPLNKKAKDALIQKTRRKSIMPKNAEEGFKIITTLDQLDEEGSQRSYPASPVSATRPSFKLIGRSSTFNSGRQKSASETPKATACVGRAVDDSTPSPMRPSVTDSTKSGSPGLDRIKVRKPSMAGTKLVIQEEEKDVVNPMANLFRRMTMVGPGEADTRLETNAEADSPATASMSTPGGMQEIEKWHEVHRPPKEIRTLQFFYRKQCTSTSLDPSSMFQDLHQALIKLNMIYENRLKFRRYPEYYLFQCEYVDPEAQGLCVTFEAEICKVFAGSGHSLRMKRTSGNGLVFNDVYSQIVSELQWS